MSNNLDVYSSDEYIKNNPLLHEEDLSWKLSKIFPLLDSIFKTGQYSGSIRMLDVGGGNGLILKNLSEYIRSKYNVSVEKYALDLSPGMLEIQSKNNPDIRGVFQENIENTSFKDKFFDIVLMIDVIEHVPNPETALKELGRISSYTIFKLPLEDCLSLNLINAFTGGSVRKRSYSTVGHVNFYTKKKALIQLGKNGRIIKHYLTNVFEYYYKERKRGLRKLVNLIGMILYRISPDIASKIFSDFLMAAVKYE